MTSPTPPHARSLSRGRRGNDVSHAPHVTKGSPDRAPSQSRFRRVGAWVLVVLTGLAVVVSILGFWVHRTVLETDPFMAAVTPIVESESVQALAGDRISDQLIEALSLETRIGETLTSFQDRLLDELGAALELPPLVVRRIQERGLGLERLASPLAAGVESRLRDAVNAFMSSPEGTRLLLNVIELTHERTVFLLRDELDKLPNLVVTEGEVRLNLVPLMAEVLRRTINAGLDIAGVDNREIPEFTSAEDADQAVNRLARALGRDLPPDFGQVSITSEETLRDAQGLVKTFDRVVWIAIAVAILLGVLSVLLAPSITGGLIRLGVAATIAAIVAWLVVEGLVAALSGSGATPEGRAAAADLMRAIGNTMGGIALTLALIGIVVVGATVMFERWAQAPAPDGSPG